MTSGDRRGERATGSWGRFHHALGGARRDLGRLRRAGLGRCGFAFCGLGLRNTGLAGPAGSGLAALRLRGLAHVHETRRPLTSDLHQITDFHDSSVSQRGTVLNFRVELVWQDDTERTSSIFLTSDGRIMLQGRTVLAAERERARPAGRRRNDQHRPQSRPRHQGDVVRRERSNRRARCDRDRNQDRQMRRKYVRNPFLKRRRFAQLRTICL